MASAPEMWAKSLWSRVYSCSWKWKMTRISQILCLVELNRKPQADSSYCARGNRESWNSDPAADLSLTTTKLRAFKGVAPLQIFGGFSTTTSPNIACACWQRRMGSSLSFLRITARSPFPSFSVPLKYLFWKHKSLEKKSKIKYLLLDCLICCHNWGSSYPLLLLTEHKVF